MIRVATRDEEVYVETEKLLRVHTRKINGEVMITFVYDSEHPACSAVTYGGDMGRKLRLAFKKYWENGCGK